MNNTYLGDLFIKNCRLFEKYNYVKKTPNQLRIMTYNVHMWQGVVGFEKTWSDPQNHNNFDNIWQTIQIIDADVLCLQEVIFDKILMKPLLLKYEIISSCTVNPSNIPNNLYMVLILMKKDLKTQLAPYQYHQNDSKGFSIVKTPERFFVGQYSTPTSCFMGSSSQTFRHVPALSETKCFTVMKLPGFRIINTHLTAYDKTGLKRVNELEEIEQYLKTNDQADLADYPFSQKSYNLFKVMGIQIPTIIFGDMNMINRDEYTDQKEMMKYMSLIEKKYGLTNVEYNTTQKYKWVDLYKSLSDQNIGGSIFINFSNWTGFRVDHIFGKNIQNDDLQKMSIKPYFSSASDHLPIFLDVDFTLAIPGYTREMLTKKISEPIHDQIMEKTPFETGFPVDENWINNPPHPLNIKTDILLFNAQPIAACNWFLYDKIKQANGLVCVDNPELFNDPFFAGTNSYESMLGVSGGIYVANSPTYCHSIIDRIHKAYIELEGINIDTKLYLQFIFSMDFSKTSNINVNYDNFMRNQSKYFDDYDTITCHEKSKEVALITRKNLVGQNDTFYHHFLKLKYVFAIYKGEIQDIEAKMRDELSKNGVVLPIQWTMNKGYSSTLHNVSSWNISKIPVTIMLLWQNS